jgi:glycosyltransferase involved in cell wall biosynthesis
MNAGPRPRITFGIIVLNGEPFTRYCLRSLYPFAHEIIVVEGGHTDARSVCTPDGHSIDGTLETLHRFKREEDPENKVQIVTREGFWPKKDELGRDRTPQSRAYAERATGDYLWQVDIDEFYRPSDMEKIIQMLADDPSISAVSFKTFTFWGRPDYVADGWILRRGADEFHRLFKWGPGYRYVTHEPPTVVNEKSEDLRDIHWVRGKSLAARGISMYHYALLFPWQVRQKVKVYEHEKSRDTPEIVEWANRGYFVLGSPYRIHNNYLYPSWLRRFRGEHPPDVLTMMDDVSSGKVKAEVRQVGDVEKLLHTWWYPFGVLGLKILNRPSQFWDWLWPRIKNIPAKIDGSYREEKSLPGGSK